MSNTSAGRETDSVGNALRILLMLREVDTVRVTDVSNRLAVARSTAHRLLSTLRSHGFVEQEPGGRRYRYGAVLRSLAQQARGEQDIAQAARPHLRRLAAEAKETSNLLVLEGADALFIDGVEAVHPLRVAPRTGERVPAYGAAAGKVLLAELSTDEVRARYPDGLAALTATTVLDVEALLQDLARTRRRGYGANLDESVQGVHAIGVPIRDNTGTAIAAVTVAGPASRLTTSRMKELLPLLRHTSAAIATSLGYSPRPVA